MLKEGIILLATNHSYYGRMSYNLALSIKAVDPSFPIAIVHGGGALNHLSESQRAIFDHIIDASGLEAFGGKLHLNTLTPFEKTLYLDVDMAWLPKYSPRDLIRSLKDVDFASITEGSSDDPHPKYYFWAGLDEIREVYSVDKVYQWRSEVMYFTKTERVDAMFEAARIIYANPGLKTIHRFGDHIPDELAINIATALTGVEPHVYKWAPSFWPRMHGEGVGSLESIYTKYYLLSCGSNVVSGNTKTLYNRIIKAAAYKMHTQHVFPLVNKRECIKDRQTV